MSSRLTENAKRVAGSAGEAGEQLLLRRAGELCEEYEEKELAAIVAARGRGA